jgi:hypothetical protein
MTPDAPPRQPRPGPTSARQRPSLWRPWAWRASVLRRPLLAALLATVSLGGAVAATARAVGIVGGGRLAHAAGPDRRAAGVGAGVGHDRRLMLFYTAEVHGTVEPCGCTSDPLGDISRLAALLADARRPGRDGEIAGVGLVDAGGLLYPEGGVAIREQPSADVRAELIAAEFERMGLVGAALGQTDLSRGTAHLRPPRLASNVSGAGKLIRPPRVERLGSIEVGVLGVVDPDVAEILAAAVHGHTEDAAASVKRDVARLRAAGAELVVLLAPVDKVLARRLAREASPDVIVLGKRVGRGLERLEQVGSTFLVAPEDELQRVGRLEIVLRGPGTAPGTDASSPTGAAHPGARRFQLVDAGGPEANRVRLEEIARTRARLDAELSSWAADASVTKATGTPAAAAASDPSFVARKQQQRLALAAEQARLQVPWRAPATGSYLVDELIPMRRKLRQDPTTLAAMRTLDRRIAAINLRNATPPPVAEAGRAHFVGTAACASCHVAAQAFWKKTVHAQAWKTLVDAGKQADYKCVSCHLTGFGEVGGSSLGYTRKLESVQCETCHGPGSLHVTGAGNEEPLAIRRDTPETVCLGCHTEQHSDTFQFQPYLRDIVGPGHGPARRAALGPGATGHELRSAALDRAKLAAGPVK